ncbi:hypothetical protein M758_1G251400 [Ceratodon purpureus]|uniref:Uncharacterized protein n=1 Tax=Ceratodon purpureus TaxID=3225 RepID=A0A8T0J9U1_CERPU|nr:hypothetical protein KC19_1G258000 [Ceratodon purpureus]KAG0631418.1 hypothetical protein M758_1G251400 [Ceratodon purpureus]
MERVKSLKELADLGLTIGRRFYGQYPETSRSHYKPPQQGDGGDSGADGSQANCDARPAAGLSRRSSAPSLLLVYGLSANCSDWISNGGTHHRSGYFSEGEDSPGALHSTLDFS